MERDASWSYELPAAGADAAGIEEFVIETRDGERVGTVAAVVRRGDETFLVFGAGYGPAANRALPWEHVRRVDADAAVVELGLTRDALDEIAIALDRADRVEDGRADAVRVTDTPGGVPDYVETGDRAGPTDRPLLWASLGALALGLILLLAFVLLVTGGAGVWTLAAVAIAAAGVLALSGVLTLRVYRAPYDTRR